MNRGGLRRRAMTGVKTVEPEMYLCQRGICTIDTGVPDHEAVEFEMKFFTFNTNRMVLLFSNPTWCVGLAIINGKLAYSGANASTNFAIQANTPYVVTKKKGSNYYPLSVNGQQVATYWSGTGQGTGTIKFSYHPDNWYPFIGGIAYLKLSYKGNLLFDGVPKNVNGVCGLWDKVSGRLFTNVNTAFPNNTYTIESL